MNPEDLLKLSKEKLIQILEDRNIVYDQTMAELVMIRQELLARLEEEKKDGEIIKDYAISKRKRVTFKTTTEEAEKYGAVKKAIDPKILRSLYNRGIKVPGVVVTEYLSIRKIK